jgi:hypothetical protein
MYIAALRVRSNGGDEGTNAFLHVHRDLKLPMRSPGRPDLEAVTSLQGGYLVAQSTDLRPGGNDVLAHLDVVADDGVSDAGLAGLLDDVRRRIGTVATPIVVYQDGMVARYGTNIGFDSRPDELRGMFDALWSASRALLDRRNAPPPPVKGPYVVWAEPAADGVRLWLPPATLARLPMSLRRRARVLVPSSSMSLGEPAGVLREMALMLLDLQPAQAASEGVELVDPRSGTVFVTFPPAVPA